MKLNIAYGMHAVTGLVEHKAKDIITLYLQPKPNKRHQEILAKLNNVKVITTSITELDSMTEEANHQGIVVNYRESKPLYSSLEDLFLAKTENLLLLVLDGVVDPSNLGSCIRSAAAFGVDAIIIPKDRAVSVNATVIKVAAGATNLVPVFEVTNLARSLEQIADHGVWLYGLSEHANVSLNSCDLKGNVALVMGSEAKGIRDLTAKKCDYLVSLPTVSGFATLNVAVATGISLYEVARQK